MLGARFGARTTENGQLEWEGTGQGRAPGKVWLVLGWLACALVREAVVWGLIREDGLAETAGQCAD